MLKQTTVLRQTFEPDPRLGKFHVMVDLEQYPNDENKQVVGISSWDADEKEEVFHVKCALDPDIILQTIQQVSQSHNLQLMEKEKEDITKFLTNRGFTHYIKKGIIGA